jgi:hypothetical protein
MTASSAGNDGRPPEPVGPLDEGADAEVSKPQRSARLIFTQTVLGLQALAALFATLVTWGLSRTDLVNVSTGWIWGVGMVLMVALFYVAGKQKERWGIPAGWVLQAPMILAGLVVPAIAVIGVMFLGLWIMALRLGGRIDRERAERIEAEAAGTGAGGAASSGEASSGAASSGAASSGEAL